MCGCVRVGDGDDTGLLFVKMVSAVILVRCFLYTFLGGGRAKRATCDYTDVLWVQLLQVSDGESCGDRLKFLGFVDLDLASNETIQRVAFRRCFFFLTTRNTIYRSPSYQTTTDYQ